MIGVKGGPEIKAKMNAQEVQDKEEVKKLKEDVKNVKEGVEMLSKSFGEVGVVQDQIVERFARLEETLSFKQDEADIKQKDIQNTLKMLTELIMNADKDKKVNKNDIKIEEDKEGSMSSKEMQLNELNKLSDEGSI